MSTWGSFWGPAQRTVGTLWLQINRDVPIIGAFGEILEARFTAIDFVLRQIEAGFDLDTATGYALETIGAILGVVRGGSQDGVLRRAIRVQRSLVLASAGTRANLIAVFEDWTERAAGYRSAGRSITLWGDVRPDDERRLLTFLSRAKPAGRQVAAYLVTDGTLRADYALDPIGDTGLVDYALDPVTGAAPLAERITA